MANLLPIPFKKNIRNEYRMRVAIVSLSLLAVLIGVALLLLLPTYTLSTLKHELVSSKLASELNKGTASEDAEGNQRIVGDINTKLAVLNNEGLVTVAAYDVTKKLLALQSSGISLSSIFFTKNDTEAEIAVSGTATTRADLRSFINALKEKQEFSSVVLPISNFVEMEDIDFSIQIEMSAIIGPQKNDE